MIERNKIKREPATEAPAEPHTNRPYMKCVKEMQADFEDPRALATLRKTKETRQEAGFLNLDINPTKSTNTNHAEPHSKLLGE